MSKENKTKKIFRVEKDKNFSVIKNTIFLDERISWGAKGVLAYALTKPDDWDLYISEVVKRGTDKKEKVSRYFKELRQAGYFEYRRIYEQGKIARTEYIISEQAKHSNSINIISRYKAKKALEAEKLKPEILIQENLDLEFLNKEKTSLINTNSLLNTDNNKILKEEKEASLSYMNLKSKFAEKLKAKNIRYIESRKEYGSISLMQELNIEPQEILDMVDILETVKKNNPNDKFLQGICFTMSHLVSYRANIYNAHNTQSANKEYSELDKLVLGII